MRILHKIMLYYYNTTMEQSSILETSEDILDAFARLYLHEGEQLAHDHNIIVLFGMIYDIVQLKSWQLPYGAVSNGMLVSLALRTYRSIDKSMDESKAALFVVNFLNRSNI